MRTSKTPLPQLLYNPHLQAPLGSAGNKGLISLLESALQKGGGGGHSCHSGIRHTLLVTTHYVQVFSFQTIPHSFAFSCASQKLNPFVFMQFRTLCEKHRGVGSPLALFTGNGEASVAVVEGHTSNRDHRHTARESLGSAILSTPEEPPCWNPPKVSY